MSPSPIRRLLTACGIIPCLVLLFAPAVMADSPSATGRLLLWVLGLKMAQEAEHPRIDRIDINSATVEDLRAVPGIERRQALRIIANRPYATWQDLARADLPPTTIDRLARTLVLASNRPNALPDPAAARNPR